MPRSRITKQYLFSEFKNDEGFKHRILDIGPEHIDAKVSYSKSTVTYIVFNRETKTETEYLTLGDAINHLDIPSF